uniref:Transmembrane protein n=1 Tax=Eptatretus burgeri TaxID=7764 RepID=A0A8C4R0Y3_EPTBU
MARSSRGWSRLVAGSGLVAVILRLLIPMFVFVGLGGAMASLYMARLALRSPDSKASKHNFGKPNTVYFPFFSSQFLSVNLDYSKLKKEGPEF